MQIDNDSNIIDNRVNLIIDMKPDIIHGGRHKFNLVANE